MDTSVFKSLKSSYKNCVTKYRIQHGGEALKKYEFAQVLKDSLLSIDLSKLLSNGFKICGLSPFDANAMNYDVLIKDTVSRNISSTQPDKRSDTFIVTCRKTLDFLEGTLEANIIEKFKQTESCNEDWNGDASYKNFFYLWKKSH